MAFLAAHGAAVPQPQPSLNGNLIEVISCAEGDWLVNELGDWGAMFLPGRKERLENNIPYINLGWMPG